MKTVQLKIKGTIHELPWPEGCLGFYMNHKTPCFEGWIIDHIDDNRVCLNMCCRAVEWFECVGNKIEYTLFSTEADIEVYKDAAYAWRSIIPWPEEK